MANITTNDNIVDKHGRTKALNNDFWRAFVSNIPTGTATLSPDGVSDTTKYLQHLNGIFVGETDGQVYLGHGLKGNVLSAFNGIDCGTLSTGNFNHSSSGYQNLKSVTSGERNAVGAGHRNLFALTTGRYNFVGAGSSNLLALINGEANSVGAGRNNLVAATSASYNSIGAGDSNLYRLVSGNYNSIGAGVDNFYNQTTASFNSAGAGYRNAYFNTTGNGINIGAGYHNFYYSTTANNLSSGAGHMVFRFSNHNNLTGDGFKAGMNLIGANNTSYGSLSNFLSDVVTLASKTYTVATNNTITSTAHGWTVGSIVTFTSSITGISNTLSPFYFKVLDANTLETYPNTLTNLTVGQTITGSMSMATVVDYTNASAFGYATQNTKSNQVALGDSNVTELLLGGTLAIDKASLVGAADGTPIVIRTIGGVKTITV